MEQVTAQNLHNRREKLTMIMAAIVATIILGILILMQTSGYQSLTGGNNQVDESGNPISDTNSPRDTILGDPGSSTSSSATNTDDSTTSQSSTASTTTTQTSSSTPSVIEKCRIGQLNIEYSNLQWSCNSNRLRHVATGASFGVVAAGDILCDTIFDEECSVEYLAESDNYILIDLSSGVQGQLLAYFFGKGVNFATQTLSPEIYAQIATISGDFQALTIL